MTTDFDPIRGALLVMLHEAQRWNSAVLRDAGIGPFDLVAIRQAEAALRTASAEPSPEVNVEARGLPPLPPVPELSFYRDNAERDVREYAVAYARAALAAQADARREGGAMQKDAERYRWLRSFATPGLRPLPHDMPMGYREIRLRVDTPVYLPSTWGADVDRLIDAAMNTTKGADHAE